MSKAIQVGQNEFNKLERKKGKQVEERVRTPLGKTSKTLNYCFDSN
jgi:hypothetical protein